MSVFFSLSLSEVLWYDFALFRVVDDCHAFMFVCVCIVCNLDGCLAPLKCPSPGDLRSTDLRAARGASIRSMLVLCLFALDLFES